MDERTIVLEMLKMQQSLNDETNGLGWENGYTNKNKLISWRRCIYMECAELIDSFAWKHWKSIDAKTNEQNLRIEVVDICTSCIPSVIHGSGMVVKSNEEIKAEI